ncbi:MAG: hypothetical protein VW362_07600 [Candidatus Nanopelagicales bacterium]
MSEKAPETFAEWWAIGGEKSCGDRTIDAVFVEVARASFEAGEAIGARAMRERAADYASECCEPDMAICIRSLPLPGEEADGE